jgi:signal transduction histidine kinase
VTAAAHGDGMGDGAAMQSASWPPLGRSPLPDEPTQHANDRRRRIAHALVGAVIALQLSALCINIASLSQPATGFIYAPRPSMAARVFVSTDAAAWAVRDLGPEVFVRSVNGKEPVASRPFRSPFAPLIDERLGAINHFVLQDSAGKTVEVDIAVDYPKLSTLIFHTPEALAFPLVGLVYFVLGALVFFRRPYDRASFPLLLFSCVGATHMTFNLWLVPASAMLACTLELMSPFYAPALVNLGMQFTGMQQRLAAQRTLRAFLAGASVMSAFCAYAWWLGVSQQGEVAYRAGTAALLALSVLVTAGISFAAARRPHPLGLRRRARVLGIATVTAFFVPSLSFLWNDLGTYWVLVVGLMATFPLMIAYAIVRLGMFDFRVVLGQGLVYAVLSIGLLLGYVGLVFLVIRVFGANADEPIVLFVTVLLSVLVLSVMQLRVQGAINRIVFRSRYVLGDALSLASQSLSRARSRREVIETARSALLDATQLTRAAVALREPGSGSLRCTVLGTGPDPWTFEVPLALPEHLVPSQLAPVSRALSTMKMVSAHDSESVSAQVPEEPTSPPGAAICEATFWQRYGLEWIVPMTLGGAHHPERVIGLLLLGPKRDGRALDASDRALLATLANQLAVAIDGADAFEQLRALKESLEQQVEARTRDLSQALLDVQRMQSQVIESEKQAVLGRLAAGIVHEINSPLGSLRSAVDTTGRLLTRVQPYLETPAGLGDGEAQRLLLASGQSGALVSAMQKSGERIEALVTSLKRFVSLDEGRLKPLDVREGLDGALTLLSPVLARRIEVTRRYLDHAPRVECDPARLNQVFLSVLENAVNACDRGGAIAIEVTRQNGHVEIAVRDTGCGIEAERLPGLFDVGFTRKQGRVAMRLGLPSSKRAIEELGGSIAVTSELGRGTCVSIALPAARD